MFLQVGIAESAMNGGGNPNVRKIEISKKLLTWENKITN
jgi:hypothetical protein